MSRNPKAEVTQEEILSRISKRRPSACPIIPNIKLELWRFAPLSALALFCVLKREQLWRIAEPIRARKRPERLAAIREYNNRPEVAKRRSELVSERRKNPDEVARLRRIGIESFKRRKHYVYAYRKRMRDTNPQFRISSNLRTYIYQKVGQKKPGPESRFRNLVGCSVEDLVAHLEKQFKPGMTWDNYGEWEIDHKVPCASFNLTDEAQQRACFHFSNLQPLWWQDNLAKWDKVGI